MQRRSNPRRAPRKRYTDDAFESIAELRDDPSEDGPQTVTRKSHDGDGPRNDQHIETDVNGEDAAHDQSRDEDTLAHEISSDEAQVSEADENDDDDDDDDDDDTNDDNNGDDGVIDEDDDDDDDDNANDDNDDDNDNDKDSIADRPRPEARTRHVNPKPGKSSDTQDDLLSLLTRVQYKEIRRRRQYGPLAEDCEPFRFAYDKWPEGQVSPTREVNSLGHGGFALSASHTPKMISEELALGWNWYFNDNGKHAFEQRQILRIIDEASGRAFLLNTTSPRQCFVHGSLSAKLSFHTLDIGQSLATGPITQSESIAPESASSSGFILYLGARIHCLEWVPNQPSQDQYLTVALLGEREDEDLLDISSFQPQPSHPSSIQLWKFCANKARLLNTGESPHLSLVLCTPWGQVKALRWCPFPFNGTDHLGILASLWGDGCLRVFHIPRPDPLNSQTTYLSITKAAIELRPPNTVFSCMTWLDSSHLAAGCADGHLAVIDIASSLTSTSSNPRPVIYTTVAPTYILSMESCYPSHPHILLVASINGLVGMMDLHNLRSGSSTATGYSSRMRNGAAILAWHDFAQCALVVDDISAVRAYPVRNFSKTIIVARVPSLGTALCCSPCHPFVLLGTAEGDVISFNPVFRQTNKKAAVWQQKWLSHEWRSPTEAERLHAGQQVSNEIDEHAAAPSITVDETSEVTLKYATEIADSGISRLVYGFATEGMALSEAKQDRSRKYGTFFASVFEEKSAITALAWNPNLHVAGWAAAGMGDGLLKISDLAQ